MAFDKYANGAWQEPDNTVQRYADGAWQECESAKRYISGAWEEIWSSLKFTGSKHTTTTGFGGLSNSGTDGECLFYMATQDGGYVEVWTEGEFVNPTVTATIDGYCWVFDQNRAISTGQFSFFADSTYSTAESVTAEEPITKTHTFSGTFSKVGFKINFSNWQVESNSTFSLYEFTINGKRVRLTDVSDYNNT